MPHSSLYKPHAHSLWRQKLPGIKSNILLGESSPRPSVFIAKAQDYSCNIYEILRRGMKELGLGKQEVSGKRILLKPNLMEPHAQHSHITTHPYVVQAAAEAFLSLGAARVVVAEGSGNCRDVHFVLEESGLGDVLTQERLPFVDCNDAPIYSVNNLGGLTSLEKLWIPQELLQVDMVVSVAKMKTHHWAGVTLSMKNLFGLMPGIIYGWPKNVLHSVGIEPSILDIAATVRPDFTIVDGIVGMEGDGPILGDPISSGVIVMGHSAVAVDATCCRIMGIDPEKIGYLQAADNWLGVIDENKIKQCGESISNVFHEFVLLDFIPSQYGVRLVRK